MTDRYRKVALVLAAFLTVAASQPAGVGATQFVQETVTDAGLAAGMPAVLDGRDVGTLQLVTLGDTAAAFELSRAGVRPGRTWQPTTQVPDELLPGLHVAHAAADRHTGGEGEHAAASQLAIWEEAGLLTGDEHAAAVSIGLDLYLPGGGEVDLQRPDDTVTVDIDEPRRRMDVVGPEGTSVWLDDDGPTVVTDGTARLVWQTGTPSSVTYRHTWPTGTVLTAGKGAYVVLAEPLDVTRTADLSGVLEDGTPLDVAAVPLWAMYVAVLAAVFSVLAGWRSWARSSRDEF